MKFEKVKIEEKQEILELYRSLIGTKYCAWTSDYPNEENIEDDMSRDALFCLKKDNQIVGVISIDKDEAVEQMSCWSKELQPSAELSRLGVKIEYQNQGIARILLQYGMEELRKQGKKSVHFLVCKTNKKAIRSYDKFEFHIVGECEWYGEPYYCYEKEL